MVSLQLPGINGTDNALLPGRGLVQVLGPDEAYVCRDLPDQNRFWACRERLVHSQFREGGSTGTEGYKATAWRHAGHICEPSSRRRVRWLYSVEAQYG